MKPHNILNILYSTNGWQGEWLAGLIFGKLPNQKLLAKKFGRWINSAIRILIACKIWMENHKRIANFFHCQTILLYGSTKYHSSKKDLLVLQVKLLAQINAA